MRALVFLMLLLLIFLQWELWFSEGGLRERSLLSEQIQIHRGDNDALRQRNVLLEREVLDLKQGNEVIERRARQDLGLIKSDEIFFQFVDPAITNEKQAVLNREVE